MDARGLIAAVESALVARGLGRPEPELTISAADLAAGVAAVAAKFLAVGTPRTLGLVGTGDLGPRIVAAQSAYAAPRELRVFDANPVAAARLAEQLNGRVVSLTQACAADIVVACGPVSLRREWFRPGTHVTALDTSVICDPHLLAAAVVYSDGPAPAGVAIHATLAAVAAGLVDGRQLDELTVLLLAPTAPSPA
jgi:ornithine cyclodeaminase/alanine dehydrogenase-like protein (mu-crystallin family)